MNRMLLARIEREVHGWPGVSKEEKEGGTGRGGLRVPPATVFTLSRRHPGHVRHDKDGLADFSFPKEVREDLIRSGRAIPHPAFPDSRTTVSHEVRGARDVARVVELFHARNERAIAREARHAARTAERGEPE